MGRRAKYFNQSERMEAMENRKKAQAQTER